MDVAPYFVDPDGDTLTYLAASSDAAVATASMAGSTLVLTPVSLGTAGATVTATDPEGLTATQMVTVIVGDEDLSSAPTNPDLVVASVSVSNSSPAAGASFVLSATVRNDGGGDAAATTIRYYRSADATITATDLQVGTSAVTALAASGRASVSVDLTAPAAGTHYYGACVDAVAGESDTTSNCSRAVQLTVQESAPRQAGVPDLAAVSPAASDNGPAAGALFTLSATVRNDGDGDAVATTLRYYRSEDATITTSDTEVGSSAVAALGASGSVSVSRDLTAPSSAGSYYYGACVDAVAGESDTTNNCSEAMQVDVAEPLSSGHPDLVVGTPSVTDSSPAAGAPFTLSATVRNDGDGDAAATTLRYYRSTDATITASDTEVGTDAVESLAASGSSSKSVDLAAPSTVGDYYYGACVDGVTGESDTADNCSSSVQVSVVAARRTPARVEVTAPEEWAPVGDTVTFTARVLDDQGTEIVGAGVSWSTSNSGVATVNASGVVTAVGKGTATITATATTGASALAFSSPTATATTGASALAFSSLARASMSDLSDSSEMEVVERASRIVLMPNSLSFDDVGDSATLTATVYDANDNEIRPTYWGWSSADRDVATVNSRIGSGVSASVQAIGEGSTTITLRANGSASGSAMVTVTLETGRVELSPPSLTFDALGGTQSVTVRILDGEGNEDGNATFSYTSGFSPCCKPNLADPPKGIDIDKVDGGLEITAEGPGSGQVQFSSEGVESAILRVTVYQAPSTLEVSPDSVSVAVDGTATLRATVKDANGHPIHVNEGDGRGGLAVHWSTSDAGVATVETASGSATVTVTGVEAGTATVTGRPGGSTATGTATVTVQ